jgi:dephospho-CoA kinase
MITIGLTGSIGMGKSTTAAMFEAEGAPVYDADAEVAKLYLAGGAAVAPLEAEFPGVTGAAGDIDRVKLRERVVGNNAAMDRLNRIVWPLLGAGRAAFFKQAEVDGREFVVLDIPLLLETGGERNVDAVVVVSAPAEVQRERVLAREGMNEAQFEAILKRQMPDAEKRAKADFVVDTGRGLEAARDQVRDILARLREPDWRARRLEAGAEAGH